MKDLTIFEILIAFSNWLYEKIEKPIDSYCSSIKFEVAEVGNELEITNYGNIDIRHLDIKLFKS